MKPVRFMSNEELQAMVDGKAFSSSNLERVEGEVDVNMFNPLHLHIGQPTLVILLEDNLRNIQENVERGAILDPDQQDVKKQLEQLLAWARMQPETNLPMALYPIGPEEEVLDGEGGEFLN